MILLLGHPLVKLKAITLMPGTPEQVGLVRWALAQFGVDIPIGAYDRHHAEKCVSQWHYDAYGNIPPSPQAEPGAEVLLRHCGEDTTLITGAPLKNLGAALALAQSTGQAFNIGGWVAQGGFAGEGIVPPEKQLDKFKGQATCPTYNLNGDPDAALAALAYAGIRERYFVSKNVCHGVYYDQTMHAQFGAVKEKSQSLALIWQGMEIYLKKKRAGKKFHDPLAACCAIDRTVGLWAQVNLYRQDNAWGATLATASQTWIIVDYDHEKFIRVLTAY